MDGAPRPFGQENQVYLAGLG
uniref:Uncharacterized protein n=1 Tax=uncultured bacterium Ad_125_H07_contig1 TaxID=1489299 RepID=A0A0B4N0C2_9BACT|nr:unknown [uncultured bacterium Ad_125_H07_contig1]